MELRFDPFEISEEFRSLHQAALNQSLDVRSVLTVTAFDFRQCLRVRVVMVKGDLTDSCNEDASVLPAGQLRDEFGRGSELDVNLELLLQLRERAKQLVQFGEEADVDSTRPPAEKYCGTTSREVKTNVLRRFGPQGPHESFDSLFVC